MAESVVVDERRALILALAVGIPRHASGEVAEGTTVGAALSGEFAAKGGCCSRLTLAMVFLQHSIYAKGAWRLLREYVAATPAKMSRRNSKSQ